MSSAAAPSTPLSLLYSLYSSRFTTPIPSIDTIGIKKQIELITNVLSSKLHANHASDCVEICDAFMQAGMTELREKEIGRSLQSLLLQYELDCNALNTDVFCMDALKIVQWQWYQLSRSLIAPITNFEFALQCDAKPFFSFIFDFCTFIVNEQYGFSNLEQDFSHACQRSVQQFVRFICNKIASIDAAYEQHSTVFGAFLCKHWIPMQYVMDRKSFLLNRDCWKLLLRQKWSNGEQPLFAKHEFTKNVHSPNSAIYANLDIDYDLYRDGRGNTRNQMALMMVWPHLKRNQTDALLVSSLTSDGMVWYQSSSPIGDVAMPTGYQSLYVPYPNSEHGKTGCFVGLRRNNNSAQALADGINNSGWWWYACGSQAVHSGGIPGPMLHSSGILVQHMELYILDVRLAIEKYAAMLEGLSGRHHLVRVAFQLIAEFVYDYRNIIVEAMPWLHPMDDHDDSDDVIPTLE